MPFSVGQGYFKSSISAEKFGAIKESSRLPEMNLWEKIKAYFFSTYHAEALECIFQLYHYQQSGFRHSAPGLTCRHFVHTVDHQRHHVGEQEPHHDGMRCKNASDHGGDQE